MEPSCPHLVSVKGTGRSSDPCIANSQVREYRFLEQIRLDLETRKEIQPREKKELERLAAQKLLAELRLHHRERKLKDFQDNSYYRRVSVGHERVSLAMIDRENQKLKTTRTRRLYRAFVLLLIFDAERKPPIYQIRPKPADRSCEKRFDRSFDKFTKGFSNVPKSCWSSALRPGPTHRAEGPRAKIFCRGSS